MFFERPYLALDSTSEFESGTNLKLRFSATKWRFSRFMVCSPARDMSVPRKWQRPCIFSEVLFFDVATFRKVQAAWETLRQLHEDGRTDYFSSAAAATVAAVGSVGAVSSAKVPPAAVCAAAPPVRGAAAVAAALLAAALLVAIVEARHHEGLCEARDARSGSQR